MVRPLYSELSGDVDNWHSRGGNTGLWYDKFCNQWARDDNENGLKKWTLVSDDKRDWMDKIARKDVGNAEQIKEANQRMAKLALAYKQSPIVFTNTTPFVTGLGLNHPVENGFAWHHSLGTPYLPGSSVKGIVRAFATAWKDIDSQTIQRIFGPTINDQNEDNGSKVGSVIFLDALPTRRVQLKVDIMTPHYGPYYADDSGQIPPADWHTPVPIPFLVVAEGQSFSFTLLPRTEQDQADCKLAKELLIEALEWIGAGAKTATGYGRFYKDKELERQQEAEEKERVAQLKKERVEESRKKHLTEQGKSAIFIELDAVIKENNLEDDGNAFSREVNNILSKLENDPQPDAIKRMSFLVRKHIPKPFKSGLRKVKPRQVEIAKRIIKLENRIGQNNV